MWVKRKVGLHISSITCMYVQERRRLFYDIRMT